MLKAIALALSLVLLVCACSPIPPPHPRTTISPDEMVSGSYVATKPEDVAGKWNTFYYESPFVMLLREDGTWDWIQLDIPPGTAGTFWFEDNELHFVDDDFPSDVGVYEVIVHKRGGKRSELSFTVLSDTKYGRINDFTSGMTRAE